ncbi:hypothetical protein C2E23DRAFT_693633, partial [Lenzites betulinus]
PAKRPRPRATDYEAEAQEVMKLAAVIYKGQVMTKTAYPGKLMEKTWASDAWNTAASKLDIELAYTSEIINLLTRYSWNLRGEVKNAARANVQGAFGFKSGASAVTQAGNRKRALQLRCARTFTYGVIDDNPELNDGLYEAEILQIVINRVFYKSSEDDGISLADVYDPFPVPGLALVLTAIQCAIDEWDTGAFASVTFSEEAYSAVYEQHLQELNAYELESGEDHVVKDISQTLSRYHAKAPLPSVKDNSSLTATAISDAVASYKRRKAA